MKEKIKEVKFVCDECSIKTGYRPEKDSSHYLGLGPFPYDMGWIYIYNLDIKTVNGQIGIRDKHFCSMNCMVNNLRDVVSQK